MLVVNLLSCQASLLTAAVLGVPLFVSKRKSKSLLLLNVVSPAKHTAVLHHLAGIHVLNFPPRRRGRSPSGNYLPLNIPSHVYHEITYVNGVITHRQPIVKVKLIHKQPLFVWNKLSQRILSGELWHFMIFTGIPKETLRCFTIRKSYSSPPRLRHLSRGVWTCVQAYSLIICA